MKAPAQKLRILHLCYHDGVGGGPKTILNHIQYYCADHEIFLLHGGRGVLAEYCEKHNIPHIQIPFETKRKSFIGFFFLLYQIVKFHPHRLVLHGQWAGFFGAIAAKIFQVPSMYIVQWPSVYTDWDLFRILRNFIVEWVSCNLSTLVVCISEGNRREFFFRFPSLRKKIVLIPNAIQISINQHKNFDSEYKLRFKWNKSYTHVLCLSRFSTQKRLDWLLKAWQIVEKEIKKVRLWIAGDGELFQDIQSLAKALKLQNVFFLGSQKNPTELILASDLVVMPTMYEGHANVPLEAMACAKPIVACDVDGVRESFTHGQEGFLIRPGDIQAFAEAILHLISNPALRQSMGQNGLKRVQNFEFNRIMQEYLSILENLESFQKIYNRSIS